MWLFHDEEPERLMVQLHSYLIPEEFSDIAKSKFIAVKIKKLEITVETPQPGNMNANFPPAHLSPLRFAIVFLLLFISVTMWRMKDGLNEVIFCIHHIIQPSNRHLATFVYPSANHRP